MHGSEVVEKALYPPYSVMLLLLTLGEKSERWLLLGYISLVSSFRTLLFEKRIGRDVRAPERGNELPWKFGWSQLGLLSGLPLQRPVLPHYSQSGRPTSSVSAAWEPLTYADSQAHLDLQNQNLHVIRLIPGDSVHIEVLCS